MAGDEATVEVKVDTGSGHQQLAALEHDLISVQNVANRLQINGPTSESFAKGITAGFDAIDRAAKVTSARLDKVFKNIALSGKGLPSNTVPGLAKGASVAEAKALLAKNTRRERAQVIGASAARAGIDVSTKDFKEFARQVDQVYSDYSERVGREQLAALRKQNPRRADVVGNDTAFANRNRSNASIDKLVQTSHASVTAREKPAKAAAPAPATKAATSATEANTAALKENTRARKAAPAAKKAAPAKKAAAPERPAAKKAAATPGESSAKPLHVINDGAAGGNNNGGGGGGGHTPGTGFDIGGPEDEGGRRVRRPRKASARTRAAEDRIAAEERQETDAEAETLARTRLQRLQQGRGTNRRFGPDVAAFGGRARNYAAEGITGPNAFNPNLFRIVRNRANQVDPNTHPDEYQHLQRTYQEEVGQRLSNQIKRTREAQEAAGQKLTDEIRTSRPTAIRPGEIKERNEINRRNRERTEADEHAAEQKRLDVEQGNLTRLETGRRSSKPFNDNVTPIDHRHVAEQQTALPNFNPAILTLTTDGATIIKEGKEYFDLLRKFQNQQGEELTKAINASSTSGVRPDELTDRARTNARDKAHRQALEEQDAAERAASITTARPGENAARTLRNARDKAHREALDEIDVTGARPGENAARTRQNARDRAHEAALAETSVTGARPGENTARNLANARDAAHQAALDSVSVTSVRPGEPAERARVNARARDNRAALAQAQRQETEERRTRQDAIEATNLARLQAGRRRGRAYNDDVTQVAPKFVAEQEDRKAPNFNPDILQTTGKGAKYLSRGTQKYIDLLRTFQEKIGEQLSKSINDKLVGEVRPDEPARRRAVNATNTARDAARTAAEETRQAADLRARRAANPAAFTKVSNTLTADLTGPVAVFFKKTKDGVRRIDQYAEDFEDYVKQLNAKGRARQGSFDPNAAPVRRTVGDVERERDNAASLREGASNGEFAQGVVPIGAGGHVADVRGAILRLYQSTKDGYEELKAGTKPFLDAQKNLIKQTLTGGRPGIFGAFAKGATAGGFGGGGNPGQGIFEGLAQSAGTTAKYALLGQTFFGLTSAIHAAGAELLDFEDSVTELTIATGSNPSAQFISELSDSAAKAGTNVGEAMDVAASGVRAFSSEIEAGRTSTEALGTSFAKQASIIATLTKTTLTDAAGNLKAIALGFNIPEQSFSRVADVLAGAKKIGGGDEKETGQGLANIAVAFKNIGFSAEESGAIVSKVIAATDEGGTLVASRLTKATSIIGGAAGQAAILKLNQGLPEGKKIEIGGNVETSTQIKEIGAIFKTLDAGKKNRLVNSLGGTANAKELVVLLNNITDLEKKANDPANFDGKGAEEYTKRLSDLRATLTQITGQVKNIVAGIATSGVAQPIFDLIKHGLLPALELVRQITQGFGLIPLAIRGGIGYLVTFVALLKGAQAIQRAGGIKESFEKVQRIVSPARGLAQIQLDDELKAKIQNDPVALKDFNDQKVARDARKIRTDARRNNFRGDTIGPALVDAPGKALKGLGSAALTSAKGIAAGAKFAAGGLVAFGEDAYASAALGRRTSGIGGAGAGIADAADRSKTRAKDAITGTRLGTTLKEFTSQFKKNITTDRAQGGSGAAGALASLKGIGGAAIPGLGAIDSVKKGLLSGVKGIGAGLAGELGPIGLGLGAIAAITGTVQAVNRIHGAVDDFAKISLIPQDSGSEALKASAANLRASAAALNEASSGFFGTIVNALEGNPTGAAADLANTVADAQERASNRIDARRKQIAQGGAGGTLADVFQFDSSEAFTNSIQAVTDTGAGAAEVMNQFQVALSRVKASGEGAVNQLSEFNKYTIRQEGSAAAEAVLAGQQNDARRESGSHEILGLSGLTKVVDSDYFKPDSIQSTSRKASEALDKVDAAKLVGQTQGTIKSYLDSGGNPGTAQGKKQLVAGLTRAYLDLYPTPKLAIDAANKVADKVEKDTHAITGAGDTGATFTQINEQLATYAAGAGANAGAQATLRGQGLRLQKKHGGIRVGDNADLIASNVELDQLKQGLATELGKSSDKDYDPEKVQQLKELIASKTVDKYAKIITNMQAAQALEQASIPPENTLQALEAQSKGLQEQLDSGKLDAAGTKAAQAQKLQIDQQIPLQKIKDQYDVKRGGVDSRDTIGLDKIQVDQLDAEIADMTSRGVSAAALANKQKERDDAARKLVNDKADLALAQDIRKLDSSSIVDAATISVLQTTAALKKETKGTVEWVNAKKAKDDALKAQIVADDAAAAISSQLGIDLSNPVQVARNKEATDRQKLKTAKANKHTGQDVIDQLTLDVRQDQINTESASFSQFLSNAQTSLALGTLSHRAYLQTLHAKEDWLKSELASMKLTDNQRQQYQDELNQVQQTMKSEAAALSGQFNLGDIKVPTVYEVRRALKVGKGDIAANNSPLSTAGNVTNDSSTQSVVLNGVPIGQVLKIIEDMFGLKARTKAKRRVP